MAPPEKKQTTLNHFFMAKQPRPIPEQTLSQSTTSQPVSEGTPVATVDVCEGGDEERTRKVRDLGPDPVLDEPNQPTMSFPVEDGRRFRQEWFTLFTFLDYHAVSNSVTCHTCRLALSKGFVRESQFKEKGFLTGFRNWKKGVERFRIHAQSDVHLEACSKLAMSKRPIDVVVTDAQLDEQQRNRKVFIEIISIIRGLARNGAPLRGHKEDQGFMMRMLQERAATDPQMAAWLQRSKSFLSHDIQDEILGIMATMIQRDLASAAACSGWFSVIADGTTDISGKEQFSVCLRYVDEDLTPIEKFVGLYECADSGAETLSKAVLDVILRLMGGTTMLRGQCYDGASNMAGRLSGVQARVREEQPKAMYVHCSNHCLDLALTEQAREVGLISDVMVLVRDVTSCLNTGKRGNMLQEHIAEDMETDEGCGALAGGPPRKLLALCPTRWTVRASAFRRFLEQYDAIVKTMEDLVDDRGVASEVRSRIRGQLVMLQSYEAVFGLVLCDKIFSPCELLARQLQGPNLNMGDVINGIDRLVSTLQKMRTDEQFQRVCTVVDDMVLKMSVSIRPPKQARKKKVPKRLEHTESPTPDADLGPKEELRRIYFEVVDVIVYEMARRFDKPSMKCLKDIERLLLHDPADIDAEHAREVIRVYGDGDIDPQLLAAQLVVLHNTKLAHGARTIGDLAVGLNKEGRVVKGMLSEVVKLVRLFLTIPISAASAERSFSALRHVKTYLRSTMRQERLSHLLLLFVHQQAALDLDLKEILCQFVNNRPEKRVTAFGKL